MSMVMINTPVFRVAAITRLVRIFGQRQHPFNYPVAAFHAIEFFAGLLFCLLFFTANSQCVVDGFQLAILSIHTVKFNRDGISLVGGAQVKGGFGQPVG